MYVPAAVYSHVRSFGWEKRQGEEKEGRRAGRRSAIDLLIAGRSHGYNMCSQCVLCMYHCGHSDTYLNMKHRKDKDRFFVVGMGSF